jgi:hypothetical protein
VEDDRDGTYGNVQIVRREEGVWKTHPLTALHPEIAEAADRLPSEQGCAEAILAGTPQLLFTNLAVASAMLNAFYALGVGAVAYEEVYVEVVKNRVTPVVRAVAR